MNTRSSSRRSSFPVLPMSGGISGNLRGGATNSFYSSATTAFASSSTSFSSRSPASSSSAAFFRQNERCTSPTRVHLVGSSPPRKNPAVRFSLDRRPSSPGGSIAVGKISPSIRSPAGGAAPARRTCMCSPTNHPGSFRCSLHKNLPYHPHQQGGSASTSMRLNMRRSAMTNSLVRIGTVEGDLVKRALAALIRPSSHHQRRRADFQPRPSRLSVMSKAEDDRS